MNRILVPRRWQSYQYRRETQKKNADRKISTKQNVGGYRQRGAGWKQPSVGRRPAARSSQLEATNKHRRMLPSILNAVGSYQQERTEATVIFECSWKQPTGAVGGNRRERLIWLEATSAHARKPPRKLIWSKRR